MAINKSRLDASESHAYGFLTHAGYKNIQYEPDGNCPPDFLIDNSIAIEVRRLNQNYAAGNGSRGLEETSIPLWSAIQKLGSEFGKPVDSQSWFVRFTFSRPEPDWKILKPQLHDALLRFKMSTPKVSGVILELPNFKLKVNRAGGQYNDLYVMGGGSDLDSGGYVLAEMERNIRLCVLEKSKKTRDFRSKYQRWWLVLVDHISRGLDAGEVALLENDFSIAHDWDKILIIDGRDYTRSFEIGSSGKTPPR